MSTIYLLRYRGPLVGGARIKIRDGVGHRAPVLTISDEFVPFVNRPEYPRDNNRFELMELDEDNKSPVRCALGPNSDKVETVDYEALGEYIEARQDALDKVWAAAETLVKSYPRCSVVEIYTRLVRGTIVDHSLKGNNFLLTQPKAQKASKFAESFHAKSLAVLSPEEAEQAGLPLEDESEDDD